jgi:type I restriction-modification system DNA methylase subunit
MSKKDPIERALYQKEYYKKNKESCLKTSSEHYKNNRDICIERSKLWAKNNKDKRKNNLLKSFYNITLDDYNKLFEKQKGCCSGCNSHQLELNYSLYVDHCHKTGKIRGLLCKQCNWALGHVKDNINILLNLVDYLKNNQNE